MFVTSDSLGSEIWPIGTRGQFLSHFCYLTLKALLWRYLIVAWQNRWNSFNKAFDKIRKLVSKIDSPWDDLNMGRLQRDVLNFLKVYARVSCILLGTKRVAKVALDDVLWGRLSYHSFCLITCKIKKIVREVVKFLR